MKHPSAQVKSDGTIGKEKMALDIENVDSLKASTVTFKFICFKTPWGGTEAIPKKFFFNFKFFTFPAVKTAVVQMKNPNEISSTEGIRPGQPYYLSRATPSLQVLKKEN